MLNDVLLTIL